MRTLIKSGGELEANNITAMARFVAIIYLTPISLTLASIDAKPINLVMSDMMWLVAFAGTSAAALVLRKPIFLATLFFCYFLTTGVIGSIINNGALGPILSALNFIKPAIHIVVGAVIYKRYGWKFLLLLSQAIIAIIFILFASDLILGNLPRGCEIKGRWGGCFGIAETYGFPNSSMNFIVLASFLPAYLWASAKSEYVRFFIFPLLFVLFIITLMSHSRSSIIVFSILFITISLSNKMFFYISTLAATLFFIITGINFSDNIILSGVYNRIKIYIEEGDISNGRFDIWDNAINLFFDRPIFGYLFDYFSNYSNFGTTHNQFLEILFKSGIVGFILFFGILFIGWLSALTSVRDFQPKQRRVAHIYLYGFFIACTISSLFQPTLTYAIMSNLVFMLVGFAIEGSRHFKDETDISKPCDRPVRTC